MASKQLLVSVMTCWKTQSSRSLSLSASCCVGRQWRMERGLPPKGNEYGPLTEIPDWSYADGRPTPIHKGELRRRERNKVLMTSVVEMLDDMKTGKKIHSEKNKNSLSNRHKNNR
ncbi:hypothetical protein CAPTEDRAFT_201398 [Capitella teleta]|uniref:Large ribosomal subunit protein mL52 n=1 Tax=Capitella teleta TaxID=283909 RepID=R7TH92_CAPTE|nr:hypothetical protein CAPTEDRAFT_201398 [Capitella teleta]|eukprot:ELT93178.1 hypothetical protein CAPTEDRAFT_201398 [Capitella teleta]